VALNGFHPVDITHVHDLPDEVFEFCQQRGATVQKGKRGYTVIQFPDCKPSTQSRLFFPDEDSVLIFSVVYGHLITGSHSKQLNKLIEERHFSN